MEDVTGSGKTEAALVLAHRLLAKGLAEGVYMALPTMATANAMHDRVGEVYKKFFSDISKPSFILAHSASRMYMDLEKVGHNEDGNKSGETDASQECSDWLADSRKKALLADIGIGTLDQALLAILKARHQSLRFYGLARKVLIIDEVHACDAYVNRLLRNLLKFHAAQGGSAILMSATLPLKMRAGLIKSFVGVVSQHPVDVISSDYPLLTHCYKGGKTKELPLNSRNKSIRSINVECLHKISEVEKILQELLGSGKCVCWVRNTVYDAVNEYKRWKKILGDEKVILFHSRFILGDRLNIEKEIVRRFGPGSTGKERSGKLVIATQVVESSLDLDFDFMVTDLAPMDLIIQRAGRVCRHRRDARGNRMNSKDKRGVPNIVVFGPDPGDKLSENWYKSFFPKAAYVYPHHGRLWLTADWLKAKGKFSMPADARTMIETVYSENAQIPSEFETLENTAEGNDMAGASLGAFNELKLEDGYMPNMQNWLDDDNAPTRLGKPTTMVRLGRWEEDQISPFYKSDSGHDWELSQIMVNKSWIAGEDSSDSAARVKAKTSMPDGGKQSVLIPMRFTEGKWVGKAKNTRGQIINVFYDSQMGLDVKGDEHEPD